MRRLEVLLEVVRLGLTATTLGLGLAAIGLLVGLVLLEVAGLLVVAGLVFELLGLMVLAAAGAFRSTAVLELTAWVLFERTLSAVSGVLSKGNEDGSGVLEVMALGGLLPSGLLPRTVGLARRSGSGTCKGDGSNKLLDSSVPSRSSSCPGALCAKLFKLAPVMVSANAAISARHIVSLVILEHLLLGVLTSRHEVEQ